VAVLGWGQEGTGPPNVAQAPQFLIGSRGVLGVYTPYTKLPTSVIIKQVIRGYRPYALTVNKRMCTAPCHNFILLLGHSIQHESISDK